MQPSALRRTPVNLLSTSSAANPVPPSCGVLVQTTSADGRQVTKLVHPPPEGSVAPIAATEGPYRGSLSMPSTISGQNAGGGARAVPSKTVVSLSVPAGVMYHRNVVEPESCARLSLEADEQSAAAMLHMLGEQLSCRARLQQHTAMSAAGRHSSTGTTCSDSATKRASKVRRIEENVVAIDGAPSDAAGRRSTDAARPSSSSGGTSSDAAQHHHGRGDHHRDHHHQHNGAGFRFRISPCFVDQLLRGWAPPPSRWSQLHPLVASSQHRDTEVMQTLALLVPNNNNNNNNNNTTNNRDAPNGGGGPVALVVPFDDPIAFDDLLKLLAACFPLQNEREGNIVSSVLMHVFATHSADALQGGCAQVLYRWAGDPYGSPDGALQATLTLLRVRGATEELLDLVYMLLEGDGEGAAASGAHSNEARVSWFSKCGASFFHELFLSGVGLVVASAEVSEEVPSRWQAQRQAARGGGGGGGGGLLRAVRLLLAAASKIPIGSVKMEDQLAVLRCLSTLQRHQEDIVVTVGASAYAELRELLLSTLPQP